MDQDLFIVTANGTLGLSGSTVIDTASVPGLFILRSSAPGPISYGDEVTISIGLQHLEVDPSTSRLQAVLTLRGVPHFPQTPLQQIGGQQIPGQVHVPHPAPPKSTSTFVLKPLPGSGAAAFADGSEFALLSDYGCLRCRNGYVQAGGAVDTDAPARLSAKFQP